MLSQPAESEDWRNPEVRRLMTKRQTEVARQAGDLLRQGYH